MLFLCHFQGFPNTFPFITYIKICSLTGFMVLEIEVGHVPYLIGLEIVKILFIMIGKKMCI